MKKFQRQIYGNLKIMPILPDFSPYLEMVSDIITWQCNFWKKNPPVLPKSKIARLSKILLLWSCYKKGTRHFSYNGNKWLRVGLHLRALRSHLLDLMLFNWRKDARKSKILPLMYVEKRILQLCSYISNRIFRTVAFAGLYQLSLR